MATLEQLMTKHDVEVPEHLIADAEVPVCRGMSRQGDVAVIPMRKGKVEKLASIPPEGIAVVRGENGGNTHLLVADGAVLFAPRNSGADLGTLVVPERATAYLLHPEHGAQAIGEGMYTIRRQREQQKEIALVQD
jgi:hypothetical protein